MTCHQKCQEKGIIENFRSYKIKPEKLKLKNTLKAKYYFGNKVLLLFCSGV